MPSAGFAANGLIPIVFIRDSLNSISYVDVIAENLLHEAPLITGRNYLFQQDNASCHVSFVSPFVV